MMEVPDAAASYDESKEETEVNAPRFAIAGERGVSRPPAQAHSVRGGGRLETKEFTSEVLAPLTWHLSDSRPMGIRASSNAPVSGST
jgi:hypothetical protein